MDYLIDDSREDKLIEDYLFSGYRPASKSTFDLDQQFAKPIQDEDLFGVDAQNEIIPDEVDMEEELDMLNKNPEQFDFAKDPFENIRSEILCDKNTNSPGSIFENEISSTPVEVEVEKSDNMPSEIDDIFIDDYSVSSADNVGPNATNDENAYPDKSYSRQKLPHPPPPPTPAQIKMKRMKEMLLEQARALSNEPKKLGTGFGEDGIIELSIEMHQLRSDSNSKFIFNKMFNKSKKADSPENNKRSWVAQKDSLIKKICSEKRKIWDSFQRPTTDAFDDEEEFVEPLQEKEPRSERDDDLIEYGDHEELSKHIEDDEDEGNFEDLEREDNASENGEKDVASIVDEEDSDGSGEIHLNDQDEDKNSDRESVAEKEHDEASAYDENEDVQSDVDEVSCNEEDELPDDEDSENESAKGITANDADDSDQESEVGGDYRLDLDEDSENSVERVERKRRAIFIDDEASEDD